MVQGDKDTQTILLNVVEELPAWVASQLPSGVLDESRQSALEELKAIADTANINVDVEVRAGHPYKTILEVADKSGAELIIVASHQPGLEDYFLGSTAAKIVRHAKCSVLVVR
jgi:nucleotide-binding universal stress UspA family protein